MFYWIILTLSLLLNIVLFFYFYKTFFQIIPKFEEFIEKIHEAFFNAYKRMIEADNRGEFEADESLDSIAWVFDVIYDSLTEVRNTFLENYPIIDEQSRPLISKRHQFVKQRRNEFYDIYSPTEDEEEER
jgi:hypothetical protein